MDNTFYFFQQKNTINSREMHVPLKDAELSLRISKYTEFSLN